MGYRESESERRILVDTDHCWCLACEHSSATIIEAASPHTPESAHRVTHSLCTLERTIFEIYAGKITQEGSSLPLRVPVLYLRRLFFDPDVYADDEVAWGVLDNEVIEEETPTTPPWLCGVRDKIDALREDALLENVLAPFDVTLVYVGRRPDVVERVLFDCAQELQELFAIDVPKEMGDALDTHRIYTAFLLRVVVVYRALAACNGYSWSFDLYDCSVPYATNEALQQTCLHLQLFADTHLDMCAAVHAHGSLRFDDTFLSAAPVHSNASGEANSFSQTGAVPLSSRLCMLERYYPHPVRAPWAGEIASLEGTPLYGGNVWNVQSTQGGGSGGGSGTGGGSGGGSSTNGNKATARSSGGTSERHSEDDFLDAMVHLFLSKTLNYPSLRRNYANIAVRNMQNFPALFSIQLASFLVSALGNYPGARYRPLWRARVVVIRAHHFSHLSFEPSWCASCGTDKMKSASKMNISKNACPRCEPVERSLWCTNRCMRGMFMASADAVRVVEEDGGAGTERLMAVRSISSASFFKYSNTMRGIQRQMDEDLRKSRLTVEQQFEKSRMDPEVAGTCDLCEMIQTHLEDHGMELLSDEDLRIEHHTKKHVCAFCRKREHDDAQDVHDKRFQGFSAKIGSKTLCSKHLCSACDLIGNNELYSFYVAKECYAFRVDREGCMVHTLSEHNNWRAYRRMLYEGMDEVRHLINDEYCNNNNNNNNTLANVPCGALSEVLTKKIREAVHHVHRYTKKTATKFKKEAFVTVLRKNLKTAFAKICVQNTMTRPQRPEDMLDEPELVLEIGRVRANEAIKKTKDGSRGQLAALDRIDRETKSAHEKLRQWHEDYKFESDDVFRLAERAAAQTLECQNNSVDSDRGRISSTAAVNFRSLRYVGIDRESLELIEEMAFNYEVLCMPDNPLSAYVERLEKMNRADFCVLLIFCTIYAQRTAFRIYPLSTEAARAQMHALRMKAGLLPTEDAPVDLSVRYVCTDCNNWYTDIVPPTNFSELKDIVNDFDGDPMKAHLSKTIKESEKKEKKKKKKKKNRNALLDLQLMQIVCPLNANSTALLRMRKAGELEQDLIFENQRQQVKKANSIRNTRERGNQCGARPLLKIAMLGVAVCVTNEGQYGNVYTLCGHCGNMFCMAEGKPMNDGVPSCGRHMLIGGAATQPYTALHAYVPPYTHQARRGAQDVLRLAQVAADDAEPYTSPPLTRADVGASIRLLTDNEYAPPRKAYLTAVGLSAAQAAARGWVRCTPSIAQPKVPVERSVTKVLAEAFPRFDPQNRLCTGTVPSSVPSLSEAEGRREVASDWMVYDSAKSRIRREEKALHDSRKGSLNEFCENLKIDIKHVERISGYLLEQQQTQNNTNIEKRFNAFCSTQGIGEEEALQIMEYIANEQLAEQSLTRRKARTENLSGSLPQELIEVRERCVGLMSGMHGCDSGSLVIVCAYCGTAADSHSCYVRLEVMDPDGLCRNRYTAAPIRGAADMIYSKSAARVELFLCETHFGKVQPLLAHYTMPTAAMLFVFILYAAREALEVNIRVKSKHNKVAMATQYDDYFGKKKRRKSKTGAQSAAPKSDVRKRTKRSRVATLPNQRLTKSVRRGRQKKQLPSALNAVFSNIRAKKDGIDLQKVIEEVANDKQKENKTENKID